MLSPVPLDNLLGAGYIGVVVSTIIYGVTVMQVYRYYTSYCDRDGKFLRSFVAIVMTFDTVHVALLATFPYHYGISNFGNPEALTRGTWSLLVQVPIGSFVGALVQLFFAYRIYRVSQQRIVIPIAISLLSVAQFATSIVYSVIAFREKLFANTPIMAPYTSASLSMDIACDALISASTIYYLKRYPTAIKSTARVVNRLITYSLNTCLLTTAFTIACLIAWQTATQSLIYASFYFVCVRLYSCSLMSTLDSRHSMRMELDRAANGIISLGAELNWSMALPPATGTSASSLDAVAERTPKHYTPYISP